MTKIIFNGKVTNEQGVLNGIYDIIKKNTVPVPLQPVTAVANAGPAGTSPKSKGKAPTYGMLMSSMKQNDKTLRGGDWIESTLMTHDIKLTTNMGKDGEVNMYLKERDDAQGDKLIAWFQLQPDGTMIQKQ